LKLRGLEDGEVKRKEVKKVNGYKPEDRRRMSGSKETEDSRPRREK
jgi:hypothetical protein